MKKLVLAVVVACAAMVSFGGDYWLYDSSSGTLARMHDDDAAEGTVIINVTANKTVLKVGSNTGTSNPNGFHLDFTLPIRDANGAAFTFGTGNTDMGSWDSNTSVQSVVLPVPGGTDIAWDRFRFCSGITEVVLKEGLKTIGSQAFKGLSNWTGPLVLPSTLTSASSSFGDCKNLTGAIVLPSGMTAVNLGLTGSKITSVTALGTITTFGNTEFENCAQLADIEGLIKEGCTSIGSASFKGCSALVYDVGKIPASVQTLGAGAFAGDTKVYGKFSWPDTAGDYGQTFQNTGVSELIFREAGQMVGGNGFSRMSSLRKVVFSRNLKKFGYGDVFDYHYQVCDVYWTAFPSAGFSGKGVPYGGHDTNGTKTNYLPWVQRETWAAQTANPQLAMPETFGAVGTWYGNHTHPIKYYLVLTENRIAADDQGAFALSSEVLGGAGNISALVYASSGQLVKTIPVKEAVNVGETYAATISGLSPGTYEVRIAAEYQDADAGLLSEARDRAGIIYVGDIGITTVQDAKPSKGVKGKVRFSRSDSAAYPLDVNFKVSGTARAGVDYVKIRETITIPAGDNFVDLEIDPILNELTSKKLTDIKIELAEGCYTKQARSATVNLLVPGGLLLLIK